MCPVVSSKAASSFFVRISVSLSAPLIAASSAAAYPLLTSPPSHASSTIVGESTEYPYAIADAGNAECSAMSIVTAPASKVPFTLVPSPKERVQAAPPARRPGASRMSIASSRLAACTVGNDTTLVSICRVCTVYGIFGVRNGIARLGEERGLYKQGEAEVKQEGHPSTNAAHRKLIASPARRKNAERGCRQPLTAGALRPNAGLMRPKCAGGARAAARLPDSDRSEPPPCHPPYARHMPSLPAHSAVVALRVISSLGRCASELRSTRTDRAKTGAPKRET